jgi:hypothetical protein
MFPEFVVTKKRGIRHRFAMTILQRIRSDLDRGLLEHRAKVLLEVIRQRIGELTLGDLREILASKLGQGLAALKLIDLTGGTGEAKPALPRATRGKQAKATKAKAAKAKSTKAKATKTRAKAKAGTFGAELLEKVWQTLHAAGVPMTSGELRAALGGSKATMYRAVRELVRAGKLATAGKPARYAVKAGGEAARAEQAAPTPANAATADAEKQATTAAKKTAAKQTSGKKAAKKAAAKQTAAKKSGGKKASAKKAGAKKAGAKQAASAAKGNAASADVSARTAEGRAQYDDKVVAALRAAGDWVGATRLREAIGGTDNQVRIALHRLIADGKVARRGARNATEYRLGG